MYNRTNTFDKQVSQAKNTFLVAKEYRTNTLSKTEGGSHVKVVYNDGSSRIYDNIKNVGAYIYYILNNANDDIIDAYPI